LRIATALTSLPYVLAVPPEAFQLQAEVNRALQELREEDFFTRLNERWFRE
jgi:ABC-type amino acid transport substrate-binding protein